MHKLVFWFGCLALGLQAAVGCGSDSPPQAANGSSAGKAATAAGGLNHFLGATGGEAGVAGSDDSGGAAGATIGGRGDGGTPAGLAGGGGANGGEDNLGGAAGAGGVATVDLPPFVCDRDDIALPFATWWASYCLAKASTRTCSSDFDECYASTKGFLESGLCTDDDDSTKLVDVGCAAAALAYTCPAPVATDLGCVSEPPEPAFLNEECRALDAALDARLADCVPR